MDHSSPKEFGRRQFLCDTFSVVSSFAIGGAFASLSGRIAAGDPVKAGRNLRPICDESTGLPLLRLPEGFRYQSYGWTHDPMIDGVKTPPAHDGMAVVSETDGIVSIVRNHEVNGFGPPISLDGIPYDAKGKAGCTSLKFDTRRGEWIDSWCSLSGTVLNCAGGVTPWNSWLSCEETVMGNRSIDGESVHEFTQTHGWVFDVSPAGNKKPVPLKDMGRFSHEAIAIDRDTGYAYETEDQEQRSGFYRFIPHEKDHLSAGGKLQMLKVPGHKILTGHVKDGTRFEVEWVDIANPHLGHSPNTTDNSGVFYQGHRQGGTAFARLEGCWSGNGLIYFDATNGGLAEAGQIWTFDPKNQILELLFESPSRTTLNMPDNLCVSPRGGLLICEDHDYGEFSEHRIHGLNQEGKLSLFAINNIQLKGEKNGFTGDFRGKEWCGASFSPDGKWLFVNIQVPGITFAITGPWENTFL
ncbi:MAG: alkaline phosphatase PhoX [Planctomycetota bacterium]|nr:alkaline phosphatase PhoX [Planctomycetota bacterium]